MGACFGKCFGGGGEDGHRLREPSEYKGAGMPEPDPEAKRQAALAAAEARANSQNLRGVQGSKSTLSPSVKTHAGGRNTHELSDAAAWN